MSDTYGGGLGFQSGSPGAPVDISSQAVNAMPSNGTLPSPPVTPQTPVDISPQPQSTGSTFGSALPSPPVTPQTPAATPQPQSTGSTFGSALENMLPGPHYTAPNPQEDALDQSAALIQQRVARASSIATNPLAQIFAPEQVQAARAFVPAATEQLQRIKQQKAAIQAGRTQAQQLGLTPNEAPDQATQDDRIQVASTKALQGDLRAFQGIQAIAPDRAAAIAPQVYQTVAGHLTNAQTAFDSLAAMENEGQYQAKIQQLRQEGTITDLEKLGLKLPPTLDAFNNVKAAEGLALRNARVSINAVGQQLEARNTYQSMSKDVQATFANRQQTVYGDKVNGGTWSENAASGTKGQVFGGIATPDELGKGGAIGDAAQRKELGDEFKNLVPPTDLEKQRNFNRTYRLATVDANGNAIPSTGVKNAQGHVVFMNDNPNVGMAVSESLASFLRGGRASATSGLLNIEASKRGVVQTLFDKILTNRAGALGSLTGEQVRPYLSQLTQGEIRAVLDGLKNWTDSNIADRTVLIARRAGALGFDASTLGLGQDESNGKINAAIEEGRQAQIAAMRPNFQPIGGGDGVWQIGAQRPGAGAVTLPPGAQQANQLPGAQPLLTPVQQSGQNGGAAGSSLSQPAPPPTPPNLGGAGQLPPNSQPVSSPPAPQPVTVAGQQVAMALPPGASSTYAQTAQRIESGDQKNPWAATTKSSSASGAFQFTDSTWRENRPDGAPDRAANATPAQQAAAFAKLTAKNATALQTAGLPVNDTNLYVVHNLGAAGGSKLLQADPKADARTVVGKAAARNNPLFFRGRPTVAVALQRYADTVSGTNEGPQNRFNPTQQAAALRAQQGAVLRVQPGQIAADFAPAALGTVGALGGTALAGPLLGGTAGGAIGSGAGQALKDYMQGNQQSPARIAEQAALGGVLGVTSEAHPVWATAGRVLGTAGIEGGATAAQGGDAADAADAAVVGGAKALGGEAFGRALGMVGHKVWSLFAPDAKAAVQGAAKTYADTSDVLKTEPPKLPGVGGAASGPNPKYDAAQAANDKAAQTLKDAGLDPEEAAYAHKVSSEGDVPRGEAVVIGSATRAANATSQGYNDLRQDVQNTGVGVPKANQALPNGPVAQIRTADNPTAPVEAKFLPDAQNAETLVKAPAANWGEKWGQLQQAGTELINKRMTFLANGDKYSADQMDNIFEGVRNQQKAVADYVFGPTKGPQVISRLEELDKSWATIMTGSAGLNYGKMQQILQGGNTPEARAMTAAFKSFAGNDSGAMRAFNAMKAGAPVDWKMMIPVVAGEAAVNIAGIPTLGSVSAAVAAGLGGQRLYRVMRQYMNAKVLGQPVQFKDFFMKDLQANPIEQAVRSVAQRDAVQSNVLDGAAP